jgi:hypothetical protein
MKLLSVERSIVVFHRKNENLVAEYPVNLDLNLIVQIVKPGKNDPLLYGVYRLSQLQTKKLLAQIGSDLIVEKKTYRYVLECTGIYDYESK